MYEINPERVFKNFFASIRIFPLIKRFDRTFFLVKTKDDQTRWGQNALFINDLGLYSKYPNVHIYKQQMVALTPEKIYISTTNGSIHIEKYRNITSLSSFTEYGLKFDKIQLFTLNNADSRFKKDLVLVPMTHITNLWHLMHHIFITYKYLKKNKIVCDTMYPIFFNGFFNRQGDITDCVYNDLIFKGLGFDYNNFKKTHDVFKRNEHINVNNIYHVNENIEFDSEPLFESFKSTILNNFMIEYKNKSSKNITFILRNEEKTRKITNLDFVKEKLQSYDINYIYLENHTIKNQLEIIANTDILIGVHGAGLTWSIFMKNGSTLIEMYPGNSNTDNYIRWCKIANIKYKRLCINIESGNLNCFRKATVNINDDQLQLIQKYVHEVIV
jgi:hypothetical protein